MADSVRNRMLVAILLPVPILLLVCVLLAWQMGQLNERTRWVEHTRALISQAHLAQRLVLDQETGLRGFVLTRSVEFLEPYTRGRNEIDGILEGLRSLAADNLTQQKQIQEMARQHAAWQSKADQWLVQAQAGGAPLLNTQALSAARARKADMDSIRTLSAALIAEEERLLNERRSSAEAARETVVYGGGLILGIVGIFLAWYLWRLVRLVDCTYRDALVERDSSLESEQRARTAAEAIAAEVTERSREMEREYVSVRAERDQALQRLATEGRG